MLNFLNMPSVATYFGKIKTPMRSTGNISSNTVPTGRRTLKKYAEGNVLC